MRTIYRQTTMFNQTIQLMIQVTIQALMQMIILMMTVHLIQMILQMMLQIPDGIIGNMMILMTLKTSGAIYKTQKNPMTGIISGTTCMTTMTPGIVHGMNRGMTHGMIRMTMTIGGIHNNCVNKTNNDTIILNGQHDKKYNTNMYNNR